MAPPIELVLAKLPDARKSPNGYSARCPAHDDHRASLSLAEGDDGRALVNCFAGCTVEAICGALGLRVAELMTEAGDGANGKGPPAGASTQNGKPRIVATYDYRDEAGQLLFQVVRHEPKDFRQRRPKPGGGWGWSTKGVRQIPYRLPELLAQPDRPVVVVEGEKDVENLTRIGLLATCNAAGAGKWTAEHAALLRGRRVIVLPDNDEPGRKHAEQVAKSLHGIAEWVRVIELPGLPVKGDASDWIAAGGTTEHLLELTKATPEWTPNLMMAWPPLLPLDGAKLPLFPTESLPDVLRCWVEEESHATQTPADLAALLSLAVCSAMIARRVEVEPQPGWREPVNLFVAVLLEPGNRKSRVFTDATKPIQDFETELVENARPAVARQLSERRQTEARLRSLEKKAAEKHDGNARHEAFKLAEELSQQPEPVLPALLVDDATSEKLAMMLAEQNGRIASMSPEGSVFDVMAGLYSKSGMPQFGVYLMGHSGDDLKTDRVSRKSVRVRRPALTCGYAMQPQVIQGVADNAAFRGRGLLARFLYSAPASWIGHREIGAAEVSEATIEAYTDVVRSLADCPEETVLRLTSDATLQFAAWQREIEDELGDGGRLEIIRDWGSKLAGATLRMAAVLHCVEGSVGRIERRTIEAAVEIARYLIPHAEMVLNMMSATEDPAQEDARYLLRWIERHGRREFTKSEAQHHGKRRFPKADDIDPALAELARRGYVRSKPAEVTGPGRPPSPAYEVNPGVFECAKPEKRSHNSRNSNGEPEISRFGNKGSAFERTEAEADGEWGEV